ncbi:hypothetical protein Tamer19_02400 [Cupriavidus sp. TA19]|nr:hypothetical protein Tamer19_02400 [Cupriavidus sp. TA19]
MQWGRILQYRPAAGSHLALGLLCGGRKIPEAARCVVKYRLRMCGQSAMPRDTAITAKPADTVPGAPGAFNG